MHLHRLALRSGASLLAALLIAASLSSATAASNRPVTAAGPEQRLVAGTDLSKIRSTDLVPRGHVAFEGGECSSDRRQPARLARRRRSRRS